jgi:hypothetical protein
VTAGNAMSGFGLKRLKVRINYLLDRGIDACDTLLFEAYRLPWQSAQGVLQRLARTVGDVCWFLRDFPRLSAYRASGSGWKMVFVGSRHGFMQVCRILFPDRDAVLEEVGRVSMWRLEREARRWLTEGADLVVCEQSRISRDMRAAPMSFGVPAWIRQVVAIPSDTQMILASPERKDMRNRVNKARRAGFTCRFSKSEGDFDEFYRRMYVPHVRGRHGDLGLIAPKRDQWNRWFTRGGLLLALQGARSVGGAVVFPASHTCCLIEVGVLDDDPLLRHQEINAFLFSSVIAWGQEHGATECDLGGSRAYCANGSFCFKRDWGARVARRKRIHPVWRFLATESLAESLLNHMNAVGFISEIGGKFYRIFLTASGEIPSRTDLQRELRSSQLAGLSGLAVISPNRQDIFGVLE